MQDLFKVPSNLLNTIKQINSLITTRNTSEHIIHCLIDILRHKLQSQCVAVILMDTETEYLKVKESYGLSQKFMNSYQRLIGTQILGKMIRGGESIIINNLDKSLDDYKDLKLEKDFSNVIASRIFSFGKPSGYILCQRTTSDSYLDEDLFFLDVVAQALSIAMKQKQLLEENKDLTVIDIETGIYKFNFFCDRLIEEMERAEKHNEKVTVLLVDIDQFKAFRRSYGLDASKKLLINLRDIIKKHVSGLDIVGRYGQDQIVVAMLDCDEEKAALTAELIRKNMNDLDFYRPSNPVSIGVYTCEPEDLLNYNVIADRLGITIFHAHYNNGNQVCRWSECMYGFPK